MQYRFIGDVHGHYGKYKKIIKDCFTSRQVGDMGVGFFDIHAQPLANPPHSAMVLGDHKFIRGNHDNPSVCKTHSQFIPDGTIEVTPSDKKIMYMGGALSIDKQYRAEHYDWWADEELSVNDLYTMVDIYQEIKPDIMVTHDGPECFIRYIFKNVFDDKPRTRQALDSMFSFHQPKYWIFGHWHNSVRRTFEQTNFIILNELETFDLDL